ncbi:MAG TPA: hypothetical protein VFG69_20955 [Nannocystaceae bacterium]|nr:hypothetical protein [Nannocystaceae bacterium]
MNTKDFHFHALCWLRDDMAVRTRCLPHDELEVDDGIAVVECTISRLRRNRQLEVGALWGFAMSYGFGLAAGHPLGSFLEASFGFLTGVSAVGALVLLVAAAVQARRGRKPLLVELFARTQTRSVVDSDAIRRVHDDADGDAAWVIGQIGFTDEALALAKELGMRCFVSGERFVEAKPLAAPVLRAA